MISILAFLLLSFTVQWDPSPDAEFYRVYWTDKLGTTRQQGGTWDVGAYER